MEGASVIRSLPADAPDRGSYVDGHSRPSRASARKLVGRGAQQAYQELLEAFASRKSQTFFPPFAPRISIDWISTGSSSVAGR